MSDTALKDITTGFGEITYNGLTFTPIRHADVTIADNYDRAGRAVTDLEFRLQVTFLVYGATTSAQQTNMANVIEKLSEPGERLVIKGIGLYTDIDTNSTPTVDMGPYPKVLKCADIGADLAWQITWEVTFRLAPPCAGSQIIAGQISAFNYEIAYATNGEGLVRRTISGYLEFVQKRSGTRLTYNPESAFDKLAFSLPEFMRRAGVVRHFDEKKNRVDFTIEDEELTDLPYPDGIIEADVDMDLENNPPGFTKWSGTLSGTLRVAPGHHPSLAWQKFFIILLDTAKRLNDTARKSKGIVIPERIRIGSKKFGRTSRFFVSWRMIACLHDILKTTGLWEPVPGTSYASWQASMNAQRIFSPRGHSGLRYNGQDAIVSLCDAAPPVLSVGNDSGQRTLPKGSAVGAFDCPEVDKERSYMLWENRIRGVQEQNTSLHRFMQLFTPGKATTTDPGDSAPFPQSQSPVKDHAIQYSGQSDNFVIMQGKALRVKFVPEVPSLTKVAGSEVEELARVVEPWTPAAIFDCPIIALKWSILYRVKGPIYAIKPASAKELCFTNGENDGRK